MNANASPFSGSVLPPSSDVDARIDELERNCVDEFKSIAERLTHQNYQALCEEITQIRKELADIRGYLANANTP